MQKSFLTRWINGIKNATPAQLLQAKMVGYLGGTIGLLLALIVLVTQGLWYWTVFLVFMILIQAIEYLSTKKQYETAKQMQESIVEQQENLKKVLEEMR